MDLWFAIIKARRDIAGVVMWTKNSHSPRRTSGLSACQPHETCWVFAEFKIKRYGINYASNSANIGPDGLHAPPQQIILCVGLCDNFKQTQW